VGPDFIEILPLFGHGLFMVKNSAQAVQQTTTSDNSNRRERWEKAFGSAVVGQFSPYRLVSLWDMMRFRPHAIVDLCRDVLRLGATIDESIGDEADKPVNQAESSFFDSANGFLDRITKHLTALGLQLSLRQCERIRSALSRTFTFRELQTSFLELHARIRDELVDKTFMFIPPEDAVYLSNRNPFGERVSATFPKAVPDIEEACRCLALSRNTACVLHLMRVVEIGVRRLANRLNVPTTTQLKAWGTILAAIRTELAKLPHGTAREQRRHSRFSEAVAHLGAVKDAWRDPSMHPNRSYDAHQAREIFDHVKAFMRQLPGLK
jgi:hypothetical protein